MITQHITNKLTVAFVVTLLLTSFACSDTAPNTTEASADSTQMPPKNTETPTEDIKTLSEDSETPANDSEALSDDIEGMGNDPQVSSDDPETLIEAVETPPDNVDVSSENPEMLDDDTQLLPEDPKTPTKDIKALPEDPEVSVNGPQVESDEPETPTDVVEAPATDVVEVVSEDPKSSADDQEATAEDHEVPTDDPEASADDVNVPSEEGLVAPFAQFVGLYDLGPTDFAPSLTIFKTGGFLWIEGSCVYLRDMAPIPLDIQAVADLDLDLEKAARDIASWSPRSGGWFDFSSWVPADVQIVSESDPAHRLLLRLPRYETRYDPDTGELRFGSWGVPLKSGDYVKFEIRHVNSLSPKFRDSGCDARSQIKAPRGLWGIDLSEAYSSRWVK